MSIDRRTFVQTATALAVGGTGVEGPGRYESAVLGIRVSVPAWQAAGSAMFDWLAGRPEIDAQKIGIIGSSFGPET